MMQKIRNSFTALFSGEATNQQVIIAFLSILVIAIPIVLFFALREGFI